MTLNFEFPQPRAETTRQRRPAVAVEPVATPAPAPKRGRGRPALNPDMDSVTVHVRMTPAHRAKLNALGGNVWMRSAIDAAFAKR
jgi:hypothetical protein